ncbi:MAG: hypothetical protein ABI867_09840 [Kofleriaceae bacterium]
MTRHPALCLALAACATDPEPLASTTTQAMEGRVFSAELALDAPWRLEPEEALELCPDPKGGCAASYRYGKVPIVVSLRDTDVEWSPFEVKSVDVVELGTGFSQHFELAQFHEIEWTRGRWPWPLPGEDWELPEADHRLCRLWQGDTCPEAGKDLWLVSEWDGLVFYAIQQPKHRGQDVRLEVRLNYIRRQIGQNPDDPKDAEVTYPADVFENELVVHLGDAPLPRFGTHWAYGDLHYHSQGTDNEGEAGYGHRATLHAVSAIGLDFVLATEHASDSGQISGIPDSVSQPFDTLRDMSGGRFRMLRRRLNASDGANAQILSFPRRRNFDQLSVPQLFLGGEVDAYPEVTPAERSSGLLAYGSTGRYALDTCGVVAPGMPCTLNTLLTPKCTHDAPLQLFPPGCPSGSELRYAVSDKQGFDLDNFDIGYARARQHLVYFPEDPAREDAFIASHTSTWGGGTRSLESILKVELEDRRKGAVFLAHPVDRELEPDGREATGMMRLGPDIIPYSEAQLRDAFASQHVLGLEAWNEDPRLRTEKAGAGPIASADGLTPFKAGTTKWQIVDDRPLIFSLVHHGVAAWDRMLRWGIDPVRTAPLTWLPQGRVRRVYFAAGSDAHGDLNYRRAGYMFGVDLVTDTAIGKPRNLVYVGPPQGASLNGNRFIGASPFTQGQVLAALREGQFVATDGPIVRVAIDSNRNGVIDAGDIPMGGEGSYERGGDLALVVEWQSTPEFGPVTRLELVVGAHNDKLGVGMTFAPREHAIRTDRGPAGVPAAVYTETASSVTHTILDDEYWLDPTGLLRLSPGPGEQFAGRRSILLHPGDFKLGIAVSLPGMGLRFLEPASPDRLYVRAFAATDIAKQTQSVTTCQLPQWCQIHPERECPDESTDCTTITTTTCDRLMGCSPRLAFSNPVWADARRPAVEPPPVPPGGDRVE